MRRPSLFSSHSSKTREAQASAPLFSQSDKKSFGAPSTPDLWGRPRSAEKSSANMDIPMTTVPCIVILHCENEIAGFIFSLREPRSNTAKFEMKVVKELINKQCSERHPELS
jgi:hypothetical protein